MSAEKFLLIADVGGPPPLALAGNAHAGCLSFEASSGVHPIFVNGGAPGLADADWRPASRATASHNTLCLFSKSSSELVRNSLLEKLIGGIPIRLPSRVDSKVEHSDAGVTLQAAHDGYAGLFGLIHHRRLMLASSGRRLDGQDRLAARYGSKRFARDIPFTIHFHLHASADCELDRTSGEALITLADGETWRFGAEGADVSVEDSIHFADLAGPRAARQVMLRGACYGESDVKWWLEATAA